MVRKTKGFFFILLLLVGASSCSRNPPPTNNTPSTNVPPTLIPTNPSFPSQTLTIKSTTSPDIAREKLKYFLQTNGNCKLPCFWGILPEHTSYNELYDLFQQLGESGSDTNVDDHLYVSSTFRFEERGGLYVDLQADVQKDAVRNLVVTIDGLRSDDVSSQDWSAYAINELLSTYGTPISIEIYLDVPNNALAFGIRLKYENLATSILYNGSSKINTENLNLLNAIICPTGNISSIKLHVGKQPFNYEPNGVLLSDATDLDTQDFYELFTKDSAACFTVDLAAMGLK